MKDIPASQYPVGCNIERGLLPAVEIQNMYFVQNEVYTFFSASQLIKQRLGLCGVRIFGYFTSLLYHYFNWLYLKAGQTSFSLLNLLMNSTLAHMASTSAADRCWKSLNQELYLYITTCQRCSWVIILCPPSQRGTKPPHWLAHGRGFHQQADVQQLNLLPGDILGSLWYPRG